MDCQVAISIDARPWIMHSVVSSSCNGKDNSNDMDSYASSIGARQKVRMLLYDMANARRIRVSWRAKAGTRVVDSVV